MISYGVLIRPAPLRARAKSFLELFLRPGEKPFGGSREYLVFLPDNVQSGFQTWFKRTEHKIAVGCNVQKLVQSDRHAEIAFNQKRRIASKERLVIKLQQNLDLSTVTFKKTIVIEHLSRGSLW